MSPGAYTRRQTRAFRSRPSLAPPGFPRRLDQRGALGHSSPVHLRLTGRARSGTPDRLLSPPPRGDDGRLPVNQVQTPPSRGAALADGLDEPLHLLADGDLGRGIHVKIVAVPPVPFYATYDVYRGQVKALRTLGAEMIEV